MPPEPQEWKAEQSSGTTEYRWGVIGGIISSTSNLAAVPKIFPKLPAPAVQRVRMSQGVTKCLLTYRIGPTYPTVAREARIQGSVVLIAIIGKDGHIENLTGERTSDARFRGNQRREAVAIQAVPPQRAAC
jgi:hypothetical protein